ncbi:MAG TPA: cellulase family glycosylhydrolase [Kofleriaceae bacterium]|nr:cellulase family glycosylhydrolase [Kofleriaceae bacterium]
MTIARTLLLAVTTGLLGGTVVGCTDGGGGGRTIDDVDGASRADAPPVAGDRDGSVRDGGGSDAGNVDGGDFDGDAGVIAHAWAGINFPPNQGTTNAGAFLAGVYSWGYTNQQIKAANASFEAMRLPINVDTANDPAALDQMKGYVDQFAARAAIICMFDTRKGTEGTHGDGRADDIAVVGAAWAKVHAVFADYPNVHYEIFNEPFGYPKSDPAGYVNEMKAIIQAGGLPLDKCIVDGMGYADDIQAVAAAGWSGDLGFHFYPNWSSDHTQSAYSNVAQNLIGDLGPRTWVTEFGANLGYDNDCYETYDDGTHAGSADINTLRGLDDALRALLASGRGVKGTFAWHGWNNGDSYDFWASSAHDRGACKIRLLQAND